MTTSKKASSRSAKKALHKAARVSVSPQQKKQQHESKPQQKDAKPSWSSMVLKLFPEVLWKGTVPKPPKQQPPKRTDFEELKVTLVGPRRAGKSTLLKQVHAQRPSKCRPSRTRTAESTARKATGLLMLGDRSIHFDFVEDYELENDVGSRVPKDADVVLIVMSLDTSLKDGEYALADELEPWGVAIKKFPWTHSPHVGLVLTHTDTLPKSGTPAYWLRLGSHISDMCHSFGVDSWHLTSSREGEFSFQQALACLAEEAIKKRALVCLAEDAIKKQKQRKA